MELESNNIIVTEEVSVIENELKNVDHTWLVVFDCDEVLTTIREQICKEQNKKFLIDWCVKNSSPGNDITFFSIADFIIVTVPNYLVNEKMPLIVEDLYDKGIKSVVLTAFTTKPVSNIEDPLQWRIDTLKKFGYNFEKFWKNLPGCAFSALGRDSHPMYRSGVICCGDVPKSDCLSAFINHANIHPKKILFIDDNRKNIDDVASFAKEEKIDFVGIEYHEAKKITSGIPFSEEMAEYQLRTFQEKKVWITDKEAVLLVTHKNVK